MKTIMSTMLLLFAFLPNAWAQYYGSTEIECYDNFLSVKCETRPSGYRLGWGAPQQNNVVVSSNAGMYGGSVNRGAMKALVDYTSRNVAQSQQVRYVQPIVVNQVVPVSSGDLICPVHKTHYPDNGQFKFCPLCGVELRRAR